MIGNVIIKPLISIQLIFFFSPIQLTSTQLQRPVSKIVSSPPVRGRLKFGDPKNHRTNPPITPKNQRPETVVEPTEKR